METTTKAASLDFLPRQKTEPSPLKTIKALARVRLAAFAFLVIAGFMFCAFFAHWIAPYDPLSIKAGKPLSPPSLEHWFGVDQLGRDVLSRVIYGSQIALGVSIGAVGFGALVGTPLGLASGYFRGWTDSTLMRVMDAIVSFPSIILALGLASALGAAWYNLVIAIGIGNVPWIARVVRSQVLSVRENDYVLAARAMGAGNGRIMRLHIWPNSTAPVIVQASLGMGYAVLAEASLSFLGVGVRPPTATWGSMLQFAFPLMDRAPWLAIIPGVAIFLLVLAFNFLGDALRDVLDPRLRGVFS